MIEKTISSPTEVSCPFCLTKTQTPLFLKDSIKHLDSTFNDLKKENLPHFFKCKTCFGLFRNPRFVLIPEEECKRYQSHKNSLSDERYLYYLKKSFDYFSAGITKDMHGLDYGCGPTKGFEFLLKKENYNIESWDKYFFNQTQLKTYDYIICHEVVEHFVDVRNEFDRLCRLLNKGGTLFIRTELQPLRSDDFENWYYKNDPTHCFFFSEKTWSYFDSVYGCNTQKLDSNKFALKFKS